MAEWRLAAAGDASPSGHARTSRADADAVTRADPVDEEGGRAALFGNFPSIRL